MFRMYFFCEDVNDARPLQGCNSPFACIKQYCGVVQSHKVSFFDVAKILNFPHIMYVLREKFFFSVLSRQIKADGWEWM